MNAGLHAHLRSAELDRLRDAPCELLLRVLVRVGRPAALSEAAERAADHADVGDIDVAVNHEGHRLTGEAGAKLVGGRAHLLDHLRPPLGEQRRQLLLVKRNAVAELFTSEWAGGEARRITDGGGHL